MNERYKAHKEYLIKNVKTIEFKAIEKREQSAIERIKNAILSLTMWDYVIIVFAIFYMILFIGELINCG